MVFKQIAKNIFRKKKQNHFHTFANKNYFIQATNEHHWHHKLIIKSDH